MYTHCTNCTQLLLPAGQGEFTLEVEERPILFTKKVLAHFWLLGWRISPRIVKRFWTLKGLSHEMDLAFEDMHGHGQFRPK